MFSIEERERVRARLLERAADDPRIVGAAVTGSAARGEQDRWSDVDLYFGVAAGVAPPDVVRQWSDVVYAELGGVHHFDVDSGPATYRAFLRPDLLEIDLGFAPADAFGPRGGGAFHVVDHAKGAHRLPGEVTVPLAAALVRTLDTTELDRALGVATVALLRELRSTDPAAAAVLAGPLRELANVGGRC